MIFCSDYNIFLEANCIIFPFRSIIHTICSFSATTFYDKYINLWLIYPTSSSSSRTLERSWILILPILSTITVCLCWFLPQIPCWYMFFILSIRLLFRKFFVRMILLRIISWIGRRILDRVNGWLLWSGREWKAIPTMFLTPFLNYKVKDYK